MRIVTLLAVGLSTAWAGPEEIRYQGRASGPSGGPLEGDHTVVVTLYDGAGTEVWQDDLGATPFSGGYFTASLGTDDTGRTIASATQRANPAATVGLVIDGTEVLPRQPLHATPYAVQAAGVVLGTGLVGQACTTVGATAVDTDVDAFVVCLAGSWRALYQAARTIVLDNGVRRWSDGSGAASCKAYRFPSGTDVYDGEPDGLYLLDPGGVPAFTAWCDMDLDGGGYTLVMHHSNPDGISLRTDNRVGTPSVSASSKLSSAEVEALLGASAYTAIAHDVGGSYYRWSGNTTGFDWAALDASNAWGDSACSGGQTLFSSSNGTSWSSTGRTSTATSGYNKAGYFCFMEGTGFRIRAFIKTETEDQGFDFNESRNRTSSWWVREE